MRPIAGLFVFSLDDRFGEDLGEVAALDHERPLRLRFVTSNLVLR